MDADLLFRAVCRAIVLPPGGPLLVVFAGLVLLGRAPRTGRWLAGAGLALLWILCLPVIGDALSRAAERYPALELAHLPPADVIVVLGGGVRRTEPGEQGAIPSPDTLERLAYAARLARVTGLPLLLSGGAVETQLAEAEVMQRALRSGFGLEARWLETRSRTTEENARDTVALLKTLALHRVLLVTSSVHMRRSVAEFHAAGIDPVAAPAPDGAASYWGGGLRAWLPSSAGLVRSHAALYEIAGEWVAVLRGRR